MHLRQPNWSGRTPRGQWPTRQFATRPNWSIPKLRGHRPPARGVAGAQPTGTRILSPSSPPHDVMRNSITSPGLSLRQSKPALAPTGRRQPFISLSSSPLSPSPIPPITMAPLKLNNQNLSQIAAAAQAEIKVPTYKRGGAVKEGIVHIGVGGFHRAHLAVYVDQLMQKHGVNDYAICGVGLQPFDATMRDALGSQDHLYTVIERSAQGTVAHVVGSINSYLFAPDNREAVIAKLAHPDTHIVSLTITESGYYYNENSHELQAEHPDIQYDLDPANWNAPRTTFGFLYAAMARRYEQGLKPFTVMSCDNMQKNGAITRHMLDSFARLRNPEIAKWISEKGHFPNAMVDRITPQTSAADKATLAQTFAIEDSWPVVTEPFMQWVIEDHFSDGRPPFEKAGVQMVKNVYAVEEFEKHKLRLLNGSHSAIGYPGQLAGFNYVHEVMQHPVYHKFVWQMMQEEVKPLLPHIPGVDIDEYSRTLIERFSNPTIMDQLPRICLNASGKIPQFIMPSIAEAIQTGGPLRRLCFVAAAWFRYLNGVDDQGNTFAIEDPMRDELQAKARAGGTNPAEILSIKNLFGDDLRGDKRFLDTITIAMEEIARDGVLKTLPKYVD
ncbi:mannitol-1-phosphate/altronate dehydrogenase [Aspergillus ellipticus CBS 707.79]|uniref:Mannitol 2-dehydrogenase n=1 Tax=Aspergillus ellipticus CBS 707.79 TaxID=1448320 RepID=A0A319D3B0_9EURO|nr:mannitol-1-phosphate/altronate dehydrogenase [Aspergillus ellipticus CBS 707.79]